MTDDEWAAQMKAENALVYNTMKDSDAPSDFSAALDKPEWLQVLIAHAAFTSNEEHMNFIINAKKFASESKPSDEYVIAMHKEFIAVNSKQEINISHDLRAFYKKVIEDGDFDETKSIADMAAEEDMKVNELFDEAQQVVIGRMGSSPWNRLKVTAAQVRAGDYE
jgi:hypothetical protein